MTDFQPGDRVRGTIEGVVAPTTFGTGPWLVTAEGAYLPISRMAGVEKLPDPPPEWHPGDVVRVNGTTCLRHINGLWASTVSYHDLVTEIEINTAWNAGDCVVLVKDGKPVTDHA